MVTNPTGAEPPRITGLPVPAMATQSPTRRRIVGVSLKMYFNFTQTQDYVKSILPFSALATAFKIDIFIIPDFLSLSATATLLNRTTLRLGAQDCFWEDTGAYTGEISPSKLASLGVSIVELGHAERRRLFGETDEQIALKAQAAERNGMTPLVCIGEVESGAVRTAIEECRGQMEAVLGMTNREIVFAYEPVWAIGQLESAPAEHVVAVVKGLRAIANERDREIRIIYGGSAAPGTWEGVKLAVDGLFLGRFAHDVDNFQKIIQEIGI